MRILLGILAIPLVLILLAVLLLPVFLDEKALVELAAERVKAQSGVELRVDGDASLTLFPTASLSATDVSVSIPESNTQIEAGSVSAGVALLPLFSRSVEIDSIEVDSLTLIAEAVDEEAAKTAAIDTSNLSDRELDAFYQAREAMRQSAQADAAGMLAAPLALEVGELALRDIRVITVDSSGATISELLLKYLTASDLNLDGRAVPLSAHLVVPDNSGADPVEVILAGEITTDLDAETLSIDELAVSVTGATPDPIKLAAKGTVALDTQITEIALDIDVNKTTGSGTVRYASLESPQIDAKLALSELTPALLVLAGPEAADAAAESREASNDESASTALPLHALRMIDTRAQLQIDSVVLDAHRLSDVNARLRIVDGVVTLEPVTATVHGGSINFNAVFDAHYNRAKFSTQGSVDTLDVAQAVAAADVGLSARGIARMDWSLQSSGSTSDELSASLNGPINFATDDIVLEAIAMEQMVCRGVALVNQESLSAEFPTDTAFQDLSAQVQLADGIATLDPLSAKLNAVTLSGNGRVELESQDLRASFRAQLSPTLEELDPACRINERYTDLRWPVECKGNLDGDPADWCSLNTEEIIKDLAEGELKRKAQEEAGKLLKKLFE